MASIDPLPPAASFSVAEAAATPGKGKTPYRRLPGRTAILWIGRGRLYLGDDHLLKVETFFFVENYKRFAYGDIRSLLLRQTARGMILSVVLGVLALGFGALGWVTDNAAGRWILLGIAAFFAALLAVNLVRGGTCRCQLVTAIGAQPLPSLNRTRPARRALGLLAERITAVQGEIPSHEAAERVDDALRRYSEQTGGARNPAKPEVVPPPTQTPEAKTPEERW